MNQQNPFPPPGGQPGYPQQPPQGGNPYSPPPGAQQQGYQTPAYAQAPGNSPTKELDDKGILWLVVSLAGVFFGFGFITGPLSWYMGAQLRKEYKQMGHEPNTLATGAWISGIVTTAITYLAIFAVVAMLFLFVGVAATGAAAGM